MGIASGIEEDEMSTIQFQVIDTACEAADQSFFPPRISLTTKSTTQIATVLGYPEYIPSTPPKRYKTLSWSGTSEQTAVELGTGGTVGDAKIVYSGSSTIDLSGAQVSLYSKDLFTPCPTSDFNPAFVISVVVPTLIGYCWPADPKTCPVCASPPDFKANIAANMIFDEPNGLLGVGNAFHTLTPTSLTNNTTAGIVSALADAGPGGTTGVPHSVFNGISAAWVQLQATHNYTATLSDEYTDAEALAHAQVVVSNGATAENKPRTTGFVSRFTNVVFTLSASNLIKGQSYLITVNFRDQNFHVTQKQYGIVANSTTATLIDIIPTPAIGGSLTVFGPSIAFIT